jgi:hypothetical protein
MHSLRSDTDTNTLYMTFSEDVTVANLARLERTALVAARVLDRNFVLVTDISDCTGITASAIDRIDSVIDQLVQFGLDREVRVVGETTPVAVRRQFDDVDGERDIEIRTSAEESTDLTADRASH